MNRRFFLEFLGYLTLSSLLTSCRSTSNNQVKVYILSRSLPIQLLKNAERSLSPKIPVTISAKSNVSELFGQLQQWQIKHEKTKTLDQNQPLGRELRLVGLGDYWLSQAIRNQLIAPLDLSSSALDLIPAKWQSLVRRDADGNPSSSGQIWGAPYRWGATALVYRKDKLKKLDWELTDWSDLWRPDLQKKIGLLNHPREVIGMTLKSLGQSYNEENLRQQPDLLEKLRSLHQQTQVYSSRNYIQPLILGDVWVAMGWTSDIIPALSQDDKLGIIFPASGSAIWADLWVQSRSPTPPNETDFPETTYLSQWIDYWWSEGVASDITQFTNAASIIPTPSKDNAQGVREKILTPKNLSRSEFLLPLNPTALDQYQSLWQTMRADHSSESTS